jgi:hypothetical protein
MKPASHHVSRARRPAGHDAASRSARPSCANFRLVVADQSRLPLMRAAVARPTY